MIITLQLLLINSIERRGMQQHVRCQMGSGRAFEQQPSPAAS
jgi:hypothetical protein